MVAEGNILYYTVCVSFKMLKLKIILTKVRLKAKLYKAIKYVF